MSRTGLWDSHAHLDSDYFTDDRDELIIKIGEEMDGFINPGCDEASSAFAVQLAEKYDFVYAAVGWHPEDLAGIKDQHYLDKLAAWAAHPKVVAIGEIGLDYYWKENEPKEVQKKRLLEQIDLAVQFDLPVIIHDRDAHGDIFDIFRNEVPKNTRSTTATRTAIFLIFSATKCRKIRAQCSIAIPVRWKWRRNLPNAVTTSASAVQAPIKIPPKCVRCLPLCRTSCCCLKRIHRI